MNTKTLYCFKIVSNTIVRSEINDYRIIKLKDAKNRERNCIVYFKDKKNRIRCIIEQSFIDTVFHGVVYSFDPSFEKVAQIFIDYYEKKKNKAFCNIKYCEKIINRIFNEYLK